MLNEIYAECEELMQDSVDHLLQDFKSLRTGKVTTSILENIMVPYYGNPTALNQVATVIADDATTITITPWEKNVLPDIESAINKANIGVNPNNDGENIKLFFPPMTKEQREESVKQMKGMGEKAKVSIRNDRKKANDKIKKLEKDKEITADDSKTGQEKVQKVTDKYTAKVDETLKNKEQEIMTL